MTGWLTAAGFTGLDMCHTRVPRRRVSNTHTHLTALCPGQPGSASTRKVNSIWILRIVSGSGISWAICKSAPRSRQITTPAPHHSKSFLLAGCPSRCPTNSVKALKAAVCSKQVYCKTHMTSAHVYTGKQAHNITDEEQFIQQTHTHTHPFNGSFSGTTQVIRYQKGKTNLDFTEARDSEWQRHQLGNMQVCTLLQTGNHASTPPLSFLQAGCPSCRPTNSIKALKAISTEGNHTTNTRIHKTNT